MIHWTIWIKDIFYEIIIFDHMWGGERWRKTICARRGPPQLGIVLVLYNFGPIFFEQIITFSSSKKYLFTIMTLFVLERERVQIPDVRCEPKCQDHSFKCRGLPWSTENGLIVNIGTIRLPSLKMTNRGPILFRKLKR